MATNAEYLKYGKKAVRRRKAAGLKAVMAWVPASRMERLHAALQERLKVDLNAGQIVGRALEHYEKCLGLEPTV